MSISVAGERIEATGNHPFWVVQGKDLAERPAANDIGEVDRGITTRGRWVEARHLRTDDELLTHSGQLVTIDGLASSHRVLSVHNIEIEGLHTYAVGTVGVLVHNKAKPYLQDYHGPKARYTDPGTHNPGSPNFVKGKTILPADGAQVYRRAIPDPEVTTAAGKQVWYGRSADGKYYRYSGTNGEVHFSGTVDWQQLSPYMKDRFRAQGFTQ